MGRPKKNLEPAEIIDSSALVMSEVAKMGAHVMSTLDELACDHYVSTGIWGLDFALGGKGIPGGSIIEAHGANGVGKSSIALHIGAAAKRQESTVMHVDTEMAVNDAQARIFLKNKDDFQWIQPESGNKALDIIKFILRQVNDSFIILDSVGATRPEVIDEGDVGDRHIGDQARMFSQFGGVARTYARKNGNILFCLNQESTNISPLSKGGVVLPGGRRWGFVPDIRIKLVKKYDNGILKNSDGDIIGHIIEATITKNRFGAPWRTVELPLVYGVGFDVERDLIQNAKDTGVVQLKGVWYSYNDVRLGQGITRSCDFLRECPEVKKEILKELNEVAL